MASKIKVPPQKEEMLEKEGRETPLLDLSDAAVKELIRTAKKRGYVNHDQINALLSSEEVNSEQIESILAKFSEMGINVVETKESRLEEEMAPREEPEGEETEGESELVEIGHAVQSKTGPKNPPSELTILCACTSAKWPRWNFFRAKARLLSPSVSRPAARP
jgi:RNA polymerase primary sigma factor